MKILLGNAFLPVVFRDKRERVWLPAKAVTVFVDLFEVGGISSVKSINAGSFDALAKGSEGGWTESACPSVSSLPWDVCLVSALLLSAWEVTLNLITPVLEERVDRSCEPRRPENPNRVGL